MTQWLVTAQDLVMTFGLNVLAALAILIIGQWLAKLIGRTTQKVMTRRRQTSPARADYNLPRCRRYHYSLPPAGYAHVPTRFRETVSG